MQGEKQHLLQERTGDPELREALAEDARVRHPESLQGLLGQMGEVGRFHHRYTGTL